MTLQLQGKMDLESCGECNQVVMAELTKRIKKIEEDTAHYKTVIDAFGEDFQVFYCNSLKQ